MKISKISKTDLLNKMISSKVELLYGKADPEIVKKLSDLLKRDIDPSKDTEDYNMDLLSDLVDKHVKQLMEAGAAEIKSGDVLKLDSVENNERQELQKATDEGSYSEYPFNHALEKEMRAFFLLKTEKKDTFKDLMSELYRLAPSFMSTEDIETLKKVVKKAEGRIFKENLRFLNPPKNQEQGRLFEMSTAEKRVLGFEENLSVMIDERKDNHDLLALKELVLLMRGDKCHPLSIGPGFFSKYIPELKEVGYLGVITKVENDKLSSIKFVTIPGEQQFKNAGYDDIVFVMGGFAPVMASALTFYNEVATATRKSGKVEHVNFDMLFHSVNEKYFDRNIRLYVTVDGAVSGPKSKGPVGYSAPSVNDLRIPAAETFLIEKEEENILNTRIYFYPYSPQVLHPLLQHGSVIYGTNDMSFHSCQTKETPSEDKLEKEIYKQYMKDRYDQGLGYEPGDVAAMLNYFPKRKDGTQSVPTDIFKDENNRVALDNLDGLFDYNGQYLSEQFLKMLPVFNFELISGNAIFFMKKMLEHSGPLTHRWLVSRYMKDQKGITKNHQNTFYKQLVEAVEENKLKDIIQLNASIIKKLNKE